MKKTAIALAILTATLSVVSCLKEKVPKPGKYAPMTFCAESEEMNTTHTKAEMAYRYDIFWLVKLKVSFSFAESVFLQYIGTVWLLARVSGQ